MTGAADLPLQGLPAGWPGAAQGDDAGWDEFIRRFLLHILPQRLPPHPPLRAVRQYGTCRQYCAVARVAGSALPPAEKVAGPGQDEPAETVLPPCPCCGGRMIVIEIFERGTQPRYRPPFAAVIWFDTS